MTDMNIIGHLTPFEIPTQVVVEIPLLLDTFEIHLRGVPRDVLERMADEWRNNLMKEAYPPDDVEMEEVKPRTEPPVETTTPLNFHSHEMFPGYGAWSVSFQNGTVLEAIPDELTAVCLARTLNFVLTEFMRVGKSDYKTPMSVMYNAAYAGYQVTSSRVNVTSSHGTFSFDQETGIVQDLNLDRQFGADPLLVNVEEYRQYYPNQAMPTSLDVLDIGYWDVGGVYEEPEYDWREEMKKLRAGSQS